LEDKRHKVIIFDTGKMYFN